MANPFTVQPLGGLQNIQMIGQGIQGIGQNIQAQREEERRQQLMQQASEIMDRGNPQEIAQFSMQNPEIGESMMGGIEFANEATQSNLRASMQRIVAGDDPIRVLQDRIQMVQSQGGDPSDSVRELELARQDPEGYRQQVEGIYAMSFPKEYEAFRKATGAGSAADMPMTVREWEYYNSLPEEDQRRFLNMKRASQTFRAGDVTMIQDPVAPGVAAPVRTDADQSGVVTQESEQARLTRQRAEQAASTRAAEQAIQQSQKSFEQLGAVRESIPMIEEAIRAIDDGAQTGPIMSRLPTVQDASLRLRNLQAQLGLNVIQNTTFGALSENELRFALDTGLPTSQRPEELRTWLERKRDSQEKLANYLEEAALFLGTPGNTVADFLDMKRERAGRKDSSGDRQTQRIRLDAQGNIIQ